MSTYIICRPRTRTALCGVGIIVCCVALLWYPDTIAGGISRGLSICASIIIPSLFPFLVLGSFLSRSGVAAALGKYLDGITHTVFGLPGCCAAGILISFVGGYPAGGTVISELVRSKQITRDEGQRMLRFCVCGGPGFIIGTVGAGLMGSTALGMIFFVAHIAAAILLGVLGTPSTARRQSDLSPTRRPPTSAAAAFTASVTDACTTLVSMCGFILLFSGLLSLLGTVIFANRTAFALVSCLLEVSCGCVAAAKLSSVATPILAFAIGFGGLSVHAQIAASLVGTGVLSPRFWVSRLLHGILTALLSLLLLRFIPVTVPVIGTTVPSVQVTSDSVGISVFLLMLCGIWLLSVDKGRRVPYN